MMTFYVIVLKPGPNWIPGKPVSEQPLQAHLERMIELDKQGTLIAGGPFLDNTGGMYLIHARAQEDAERILAEDPAITSGVCEGMVHLWNPLINHSLPELNELYRLPSF